MKRINKATKMFDFDEDVYIMFKTVAASKGLRTHQAFAEAMKDWIMKIRYLENNPVQSVSNAKLRQAVINLEEDVRAIRSSRKTAKQQVRDIIKQLVEKHKKAKEQQKT